jgi:low affinity Fe/Cu permease
VEKSTADLKELQALRIKRTYFRLVSLASVLHRGRVRHATKIRPGSKWRKSAPTEPDTWRPPPRNLSSACDSDPSVNTQPKSDARRSRTKETEGRKAQKTNNSKSTLERFSESVSSAAGSSSAFGLAFLVVLVWAVTGPVFHYSDTWQLVINTGTTIVTFLMVFLIQRSQNKESLAVQLKLNEVVAAINGASNRLIDVEELSEAELEAFRAHYQRLIGLAKEGGGPTESHSVEEAHEGHGRKAAHEQESKHGNPRSGDAQGAQRST